jgi:hypothetical protein
MTMTHGGLLVEGAACAGTERAAPSRTDTPAPSPDGRGKAKMRMEFSPATGGVAPGTRSAVGRAMHHAGSRVLISSRVKGAAPLRVVVREVSATRVVGASSWAGLLNARRSRMADGNEEVCVGTD